MAFRSACRSLGRDEVSGGPQARNRLARGRRPVFLSRGPDFQTRFRVPSLMAPQPTGPSRHSGRLRHGANAGSVASARRLGSPAVAVRLPRWVAGTTPFKRLAAKSHPLRSRVLLELALSASPMDGCSRTSRILCLPSMLERDDGVVVRHRRGRQRARHLTRQRRVVPRCTTRRTTRAYRRLERHLRDEGPVSFARRRSNNSRSSRRPRRASFSSPRTTECRRVRRR